MNIKPIKTDGDYQSALREIEGLMASEYDTPDGDRLDILVTLVEAWERKNYPMDLPNPVEAIKFEMERSGLTINDLKPIIGRSNRVYEILYNKRPLTLRMIYNLHFKLGIPAESLIRQDSIS